MFDRMYTSYTALAAPGIFLGNGYFWVRRRRSHVL